jgi:flavin reductase (DIM6/NTAB) family NADH-FMN oxidoreductase RutF
MKPAKPSPAKPAATSSPAADQAKPAKPVAKPGKKLAWPGSTLLSPVPAVMVSCGGTGTWKPNIITLAWVGTVCSTPPLVSISIRPERHSYEIIRSTGEFVINIPTEALARATDLCGVISGRDHDKFTEAGLTAAPAIQVKAPIIRDCPLNLECRVRSEHPLGSHTMFIAEVVGVQVSDSFVDEKGKLSLDKKGLLAYAHGHYYALGRCLGHFGFAVRRKPGPIVRK